MPKDKILTKVQNDILKRLLKEGPLDETNFDSKIIEDLGSQGFIGTVPVEQSLTKIRITPLGEAHIGR